MQYDQYSRTRPAIKHFRAVGHPSDRLNVFDQYLNPATPIEATVCCRAGTCGSSEQQHGDGGRRGPTVEDSGCSGVPGTGFKPQACGTHSLDDDRQAKPRDAELPPPGLLLGKAMPSERRGTAVGYPQRRAVTSMPS